MQTVMSYLPYLILPVMAIYIYLFYRAMGSLGKEERRLYNQVGSRWKTGIILFVLIGMIFYGDFWFRLACVIMMIIIQIVWAPRHRNRMKELEFDAEFLQRLRRANYVGILVTGMACVYLLLEAYPK
jgi:hypothetical protein